MYKISEMGRKAAHQFVMWPKVAKWLIIVLSGLYLVFGKHPEIGEFTLTLANLNTLPSLIALQSLY